MRLVERDVARQTGVRVHAAAEHELPGPRLPHPHADVLERVVQFVRQHVHRRRLLRVEDAEPREPHPGVFELRVLENLPRPQVELVQDDAVASDLVALDDDAADAVRHAAVAEHVVLHLHQPRPDLGPQLLDAGRVPAETVVVAKPGLVALRDAAVVPLARLQFGHRVELLRRVRLVAVNQLFGNAVLRALDDVVHDGDVAHVGGAAHLRRDLHREVAERLVVIHQRLAVEFQALRVELAAERAGELRLGDDLRLQPPGCRARVADELDRRHLHHRPLDHVKHHTRVGRLVPFG